MRLLSRKINQSCGYSGKLFGDFFRRMRQEGLLNNKELWVGGIENNKIREAFLQRIAGIPEKSAYMSMNAEYTSVCNANTEAH
jgi:hypothetical protein